MEGGISLIRGSELDDAIAKTEEKFKRTLSRSLATSTLDEMAKLKEEYPFKEAIRFALNKAGVQRDEREIYASLIGTAFGRRANFAKKRKKNKDKKLSVQGPTFFYEEDDKQGKLRI